MKAGWIALIVAVLVAAVLIPVLIYALHSAETGSPTEPVDAGETPPPPTPPGPTVRDAPDQSRTRPTTATQPKENPVVEMKTSKGAIKIELYDDKAPKTVENFLTYVDEGFYDGTIFHRVIPDFMVQGGGFTKDLERKETHDTIEHEGRADLKNTEGAVAMARTSDPHSASSQFFINVADNDFLDFREKTPRGYGYTVFGKVVEGMDVVKAIEKVPTTRKKGMDDVPEETVVIESVRRVES